MCWFSAFNRFHVVILHENLRFKTFFTGFKMIPDYFIKSLLDLNTLADATCLSSAYTHVVRQQTFFNAYLTKYFTFLFLFFSLALINLECLIIMKKLRCKEFNINVHLYN